MDAVRSWNRRTNQKFSQYKTLVCNRTSGRDCASIEQDAFSRGRQNGSTRERRFRHGPFLVLASRISSRFRNRSCTGLAIYSRASSLSLRRTLPLLSRRRRRFIYCSDPVAVLARLYRYRSSVGRHSATARRELTQFLRSGKRPFPVRISL